MDGGNFAGEPIRQAMTPKAAAKAPASAATLPPAGTGLLAGWVMQTLPAWALWAALAAFAGGAFMVFEGVKGWCVMRAMGFKTPM